MVEDGQRSDSLGTRRTSGWIRDQQVEPKYIKHDRWGRVWLMLNCDIGAPVTALPVSVAGNLPLEKRGEFESPQEQSFQTWARSR